MAFRKYIKRDCSKATKDSVIQNVQLLPAPFPMENPNNDCHMNSLVQCLVSLPSVIEDYRITDSNSSYWARVIQTLREQAEEREAAEYNPELQQSYTEFYQLGAQLSRELGISCGQEDPKEALFKLIDNRTLDHITFDNIVSTTEVCKCDNRGSNDQISAEYMLYDLAKYIKGFRGTSNRRCDKCTRFPTEHTQLVTTSDVLVALTPICALRNPQPYGTRIRVNGNIYTLMSQLIYNQGRGCGVSGHYYAEGYRFVNRKFKAYRLDDERNECIGSTLKYNPAAVVLFYHLEKSPEPEVQDECEC